MTGSRTFSLAILGLVLLSAGLPGMAAQPADARPAALATNTAAPAAVFPPGTADAPNGAAAFPPMPPAFNRTAPTPVSTVPLLAAAEPVAAAPAPAVAVAAAVAGAGAVAAPALPGTSTAISAGDTAWMLTSTALVLLMTIPGLALFYAGMVRKKNVLDTMAHSFVTTCIVTLLWVACGYSLAFTEGTPLLGGLSRQFMHGMTYLKSSGLVSVHALAPTIPESVFMMYQMTFAIITPALITGAFAERIKFSALIGFTVLWSLLVYVPVAHWVWAADGWLSSRGMLDFAGGTVVHINAGISGLVAALIVGPRTGFRRIQMAPHNLSLTVMGASLLWVGWFGFNAGSAGAADGRAGMAMMVTQISTAVAALSWMSIEWIRRGRPSVLGLVSGAVAGLVAITPASGFVGVEGAIAIGAISGVACFLAATSLKEMFRYDDTLDVFGVHAVGGVIGALLTGIFAQKAIGGADGSFGVQALGVAVTMAYAGAMTAVILGLLHMTVGLRVTPAEEDIGLDEIEHGERLPEALPAA